MPTNFRPGVLPDDEPRRRPGQEIGRAFDDFIRSRATIEAGDRADQASSRADRADTRAQERHEFGSEVDRFRFGRELEDEGFVRESEFDRTGRGTRSPGTPGNRLDPNRDPFEGRRIGMGRVGGGPAADEFDRFREAGPEAMREPVVLPGQFTPGAGFSPTAIFLPETQEAPPRREPRREEIMGDEFIHDPSRTADARQRSETEARERRAFQEEVDRLIQAGVPEDQAPAVAEQGLAGSFIGPEQPGPMQYTADELRAAGVAEGAIPAAMRNPELAEDLINEANRRFSPPAGSDDRFNVGDLDQALEIIDNEYGEYDQEGFLIGHRLDRQARFDLADRIVRGELDPRDLPNVGGAAAEPAPEGEEEGPGIIGRAWDAVADRVGGMRELVGQGPETENVTPGVSMARVRDASRTIQEEFPDADDALLRQILTESRYSPAEIDSILRDRR